MSRKLAMRLVGLLVVAVILAMMCAFQVRFTETVVVTRFDEVKRVIPPGQAGLHFMAPWPIDEVHRYDARLRSFDTEFRQLGTQDQKTVILTAYATWRIDDARKFLRSLGRQDAAVQKIRDLLENQVSNVLRTHKLENLVNIDKEKIHFAEIERAFLDGIKDAAEEDYGIEVVSVGIKRLGIPESVTKDVFARMKEDRQKEIKQLTAEGDAEAKKIRAEAEEVSKKIQARARAYATTIEGQADAEAAKYYSVFEENRNLSSFLKKLEAVRRIFAAGQITLVMDAKDVVPFDVLNDVGKSGTDDGGARKSADGEDRVGDTGGTPAPQRRDRVSEDEALAAAGEVMDQSTASAGTSSEESEK